LRPGWLLGALLGVFALFLIWVAVDSGIHMGAAGFQVLPAVMDLSKYVAAFMTAVTLALAVRSRVLTGAAARRLLMWSSLFFIAVAYACLVAYWVGFRFEDGLVIKSFGDAWGVWPTNTAVPRLVGLSTEPQQFSVVYVTGLLAMMQERRARWQIAAAFGVIALLLSQSKYSLLSVVVAAVWWFCNVGVARGFGRRKWVASGVAAVIVLVGALGAASLLPSDASDGLERRRVHGTVGKCSAFDGSLRGLSWSGDRPCSIWRVPCAPAGNPGRQLLLPEQ
jgi:hypothetical protein